ncbi:hypothetical protein Ahy_A10g050265 [Arachis hypogaea]|uniref:Uncharacterized protein n=1 Tax=Arachis hypogaea TaxID=3818 RepID=A0A445B8W7_ARAHY|nr:hypothetical protein Ahy_A10g050265 [Arachis hypogaea]
MKEKGKMPQEIVRVISHGQNADDVLARLRTNQVESSEEESDLEADVDLAELKKGLPYVCSLLKKLLSNEKSNDSKLKSGKRYRFDISKSDQIFDVLLKDK